MINEWTPTRSGKPPTTSNRTHRQPNPLDPGILLGAMRDQLGLAVKSQKGPVDFLVIDSVEKVVAGN